MQQRSWRRRRRSSLPASFRQAGELGAEGEGEMTANVLPTIFTIEIGNKLRARIALPDESALFAEANNNGQPSDGLMLVYLVELDGEEPPVDPGAFPPART
jgi:hypothetical protein